MTDKAQDQAATSLVGVVKATLHEMDRGVKKDGQNRVLAIGPAWVAVDEVRRKRDEAKSLHEAIKGTVE